MRILALMVAAAILTAGTGTWLIHYSHTQQPVKRVVVRHVKAAEPGILNLRDP